MVRLREQLFPAQVHALSKSAAIIFAMLNCLVRQFASILSQFMLCWLFAFVSLMLEIFTRFSQCSRLHNGGFGLVYFNQSEINTVLVVEDKLIMLQLLF